VTRVERARKVMPPKRSLRLLGSDWVVLRVVVDVLSVVITGGGEVSSDRDDEGGDCCEDEGELDNWSD
jgi:hypothetical protein